MENYTNNYSNSNNNSNIAFINKTSLRNLIGEVVEEKLIAFSHWLESKMVNDDKNLSRKETSEYLGIGVSTLDKYEKIGLIKKQRLGGRVFYNMEEIKRAQKGINEIQKL